LKSDDGHIYVGAVVLRVNPDGTGLRVVGHNMRNSYEETVTSFGDVFQNDNDDPPACRTTWLMEYGNLGFVSDDGTRKWQTERRPGQSAPIAEWRQEDPGTIPAGDVYGTGSPTGICFYENGSLGDDYSGLLLSGEAARNVIFGYLPKPDGAGFTLERFDFFRSKRANEFPKGQENKANLANQFRPSDVCVGPDGAIYVADWFDPGVGGHAMRDLDYAAAIYRITRKGENPRPPKFDINTVEGQIASLKSPATRALRFVEHKLLEHARALAGDPSIAVRREVALALRNMALEDCGEIIVELASQYKGEDRWYLEAIGTASSGKEAAIYPRILKALNASEDPVEWSPSPGACIRMLPPRPSRRVDFPVHYHWASARTRLPLWGSSRPRRRHSPWSILLKVALRTPNNSPCGGCTTAAATSGKSSPV
jgi:hypothetical protein